jgi:hypothetical protein
LSWQTRYDSHFRIFSWGPQKSDSLTKFIADRQDTQNMRISAWLDNRKEGL